MGLCHEMKDDRCFFISWTAATGRNPASEHLEGFANNRQSCGLVPKSALERPKVVGKITVKRRKVVRKNATDCRKEEQIPARSGGRSAHIEAGWMAGAGKRVLLYIPEMVEPELMYRLFDHVTGSLEELIGFLAAE